MNTNGLKNMNVQQPKNRLANLGVVVLVLIIGFGFLSVINANLEKTAVSDSYILSSNEKELKEHAIAGLAVKPTDSDITNSPEKYPIYEKSLKRNKINQIEYNGEVIEINEKSNMLIKTTPDEIQEEYAQDRIIIKFKENNDAVTFINDANTITGQSQLASYLRSSAGLTSAEPVFKEYYIVSKGTTYRLSSTSLQEKLSILKDKQGLENKQNPKAPADTPDISKNLPDQKLENIVLVKLEPDKSKSSVIEIVADVKERYENIITYAEPDFIMRAEREANDPFFSSEGTWGQDYEDLWGLHRIDIEEAWDTSVGSDEIIVAIIDTGVDIDHPDIEDNIWINEEELNGEQGRDDDDNGKVDDVYGWNFVSDNNNPADRNGHGTHCAGTVAATGNNELGIVGVSWNTKIMALKGLNDEGKGYTNGLAAAIRYAAVNGAQVLSNSWGFYGWSNTLADAVDYAHDLGSTIIAAAGNSDTRVEHHGISNIPRVIAVGAIDANDMKASFSNYGTKVDVMAPGTDTLSLRSEGTGDNEALIVDELYYRMSGTSMATPHVSGLIALLLANNPELTNEEIRQILRTTADEQNLNGWDYWTSYGSINANNAINSDPVCAANIMAPVDNILYPEDLIVSGDVEIQFYAYGENYDTFDLEVMGRLLELGLWVDYEDIEYNLVSEPENPVTEPYVVTIDADTLPTEGYNTLKLNVMDTEGNIFWDTVILKVDDIGITSPSPDHSIKPHGEIDIIGRVNNEQFESYTIGYGEGFEPEEWSSEGIELRDNGERAVEDGVLGTWDVSMFEEHRGIFSLKVTERLQNGMERSEIFQIYFDPLLKEGWPAKIEFQEEYEHSTFVSDVIIGDLDNDGYKELVTTGHWTREVLVYNHDGSVRDGWPVSLDRLLDRQVYLRNFISLGDINNDDNLEIILQSSKYAFVLQHDGSVLEGWPVYIKEEREEDPEPFWGREATVADIDGDGNKEIISTGQGYYDEEEDGDDGVFARIAAINAEGEIIWSTELDLNMFILLNFGGVYTVPAIADLDHDGDKEIVYTKYRKIYCLDHNGEVLWDHDLPNYGYGTPSLADVDGDGDLEIFLLNGEDDDEFEELYNSFNAVYAWHHDGSVLEGYPVVFDEKHTGNIRSYSTAIGDVNNDGSLELAVRCKRLNGSYVLNAANGEILMHLADKEPRMYSNPIIGNLDESTFQEIIMTNNVRGDQDWVVGLQTNPEILEQEIDYTEPFPFITKSPERGTPQVADLDNDGILEIITIAKGDYIYVWDYGQQQNPNNEWPMLFADYQRSSSYNWAPELEDLQEELITRPNGAVNFEVRATDPDEDTPKLLALNLPEGAEFVDNEDGTGEFTWETNENDVRREPYIITVKAVDRLQKFHSAIVEIYVGGFPGFEDFENLTVEEMANIEFIINANDINGQELRLSAEGLPDDAEFVDNEDGLGLLSWQTDYLDAGVYEITFTVVDEDNLEDVRVLRIAVEENYDYHVITLEEGWNLISSYNVPPELDIETIFAQLLDENSLVQVKDQDGAFYFPEYRYNGLGDWNPQQAYDVNVNRDTSFIIHSEERAPTVVNLRDRWNFIAYPLTAPRNVEYVLAPLVEENRVELIKNSSGDFYAPGHNYNGLGNLVPGQGYKIKVNGDVRLDFVTEFFGDEIRHNGLRIYGQLTPAGPGIANVGRNSSEHFCIEHDFHGVAEFESEPCPEERIRTAFYHEQMGWNEDVNCNYQYGLTSYVRCH